MLLVKACCEHLLHEVVDLVYRVELADLAPIARRLDLIQVSEMGRPHIFILDDRVKLSLLPSIFYSPIHLGLISLLHLCLILGPLCIFLASSLVTPDSALLLPE